MLLLLDKDSCDAELEELFSRLSIFDRPQTLDQINPADYFDECDDDADIEYELHQIALSSLRVESTRLGLCFIFKSREDYLLTHKMVPAGDGSFIVEQIAFFDRGFLDYQRFQGILPGGMEFGVGRNDSIYQAIGKPLATRIIYEMVVDLFIIENRIVNFGFSYEGQLIHVHVRNRNIFDDVMLSPEFKITTAPVRDMVAASLIGKCLFSPEVKEFFFAQNMGTEEELSEGYPGEITAIECSHGITLYFSGSSSGPCISSVAYRRRGDQYSAGYPGVLPMGFAFGDSPDTLVLKAGQEPMQVHQSDQLVSNFWTIDDGIVVQAVCSLIDWQLYKVVIHAEFAAGVVLN